MATSPKKKKPSDTADITDVKAAKDSAAQSAQQLEKLEKALRKAIKKSKKAEEELAKAHKAKRKKKETKAQAALEAAQKELASVQESVSRLSSKGVEAAVTEAAETATAAAEGSSAIVRPGTSTAEVDFTPGPKGVRITAAPVSLAEIDPASAPDFEGDKAAGEAALAEGAEILSTLQEKLFAQSRVNPETPAVLLVLQGMDTSGKGGIVRHVVGAVDPQGVSHVAFKAPTDEEKQHDFLWRIEKRVPSSGMIGVFDRSHYEDVLIHRVHGWADAAEIERRYEAINDFEQFLAGQNVVVVKAMLHISRDEQANRLQERLDRPDKYWKYNPGDIAERAHWDAYQEAYEKALEATSSEASPWNVIPADRKWYARLAVQNLLIEALHGIDPQWPKAHFNVGAERARLTATR